MSTIDELRRKRDTLKSKGKTVSTSTSLAKLEDQIKSFKNTNANSSFTSPDSNFLKDKISGFFGNQRQQTNDFMSGVREKFNVDALENTSRGINNQLLNVEGQLEALPEQVQNESRGFDVNAAQLAAITQSKQAPLVNQISQLGRASQRAGDVLSDARQAVRDETSLFTDQLARETSGFFFGAEAELQALRDKANKGFQMTENEKDRLFALDQSEKEFARQKELIGMQSANNKDLEKFRTDENIRQTLATRKPKSESEILLEQIKEEQLIELLNMLNEEDDFIEDNSASNFRGLNFPV